MRAGRLALAVGTATLLCAGAALAIPPSQPPDEEEVWDTSPELVLTKVITTKVEVPAKLVEDHRALPAENDKGRCVAVSFVEYPAKWGATARTATITYNGKPHSTDPRTLPPTMGDAKTGVIYGGVEWHWPASVFRVPIGSYSVGTGCDDAVAGALKGLSVTGGEVTTSRGIYVWKPRKKPRIDPDYLGRVVEISPLKGRGDGVAWKRGKDGRLRRLRPGSAIKKGDVVTTAPGTGVRVEIRFGIGLVGINQNRDVLFADEDDVRDLTDTQWRRTIRHSEKVWDKIEKRPKPMEIETATGGAMTIKG